MEHTRHIVHVDRLAAGGYGLGRLEGRVLFLAGALPGERVVVELLETKADYGWARPVEILDPHPDRRVPACPLFLICGGCQLLHLKDEAQLAMKAGAVLEKVRAGFDGPLDLHPSPYAFFYRDRARLHVDHVAGRLTLGYYGAGSKRLIPVPFCPQLHPRLNRLLPGLSEWIGEMTGKTKGTVGLNLVHGRLDEPVVVGLELEHKPSPGLWERVRESPDPSVRVQVFVGGRSVESGRPETLVTALKLQDPDVRLVASAGVFTQVNGAVNHLLALHMVQKAMALGARRILDLYSGYGNFAFPLAAATGGTVTLVEEHTGAVRNARLNQDRTGLKNVRILAGDAVRTATRLADENQRFDLIVLDPPRSGAKGFGPAAGRLGARHILYVSCHPAAMARDLVELRSMGYGLRELSAWDMFPQTAHLETLALLER